MKLSKKAKIMISILLAVLVISLIIVIKNYITFLNYKRDVEAIEVQSVDLNTIADGEYFGDCNIDLVRVRTRVVVKDRSSKKKV